MVLSCTKEALDATMKKSDSLVVIGTSRKRERLKKTWIETIKNDLKVLNLTNNILGLDLRDT